ncbi:MAG: hypothetical protein PHX54_06375 [Lentimicrobiaceae bacterium]|nr:hypothetical protein [Lentimicrobiaceae bacterium]
MKWLKHIMYCLLMLMLALPLVQRTIPFFEETPLNGYFVSPRKPSVTMDSIFDGTFQDAYNNYYEHTIGFRPLLIRINNQLAFSVFDTALANGVIIGKKNYLYEINYIKAYKGWDYQGDSAIESHARKAGFVYKELTQAGKTLLFVFAPGKATFFPEYIPDKYMKRPSGKNTNYQEFIKMFDKYKLPYIDFNQWFVQMKDTASYPLYPQCGIHWSAYGVALATDSLIRYIEYDRDIDMVDFGWNGFDLPDTLRKPDYDIADGMNLLFTIPHYPMAYPRTTFSSYEGKIRPNAIVVADSYYWNIFGTGFSSRLFDDNNFWYYNKETYNPAWPATRNTNELDMLSELIKADVIIIMATDANLYQFPYGFIERAYNTLSENRQQGGSLWALSKMDTEIEQIMKSIDADPQWKAKVMEKALDRKISYDEMLKLDAIWIWENKKN